MKNQISALSLVHGAKQLAVVVSLVAPLGVFWACSDDNVSSPSQPDSGTPATVVDAGADSGEPGLSCGNTGNAPPRILVVQGGAGASELAVIDTSTKAVEGRYAFEGSYGTTSGLGADPFLLGGESDMVFRLDAREPWKVAGSWNVHGEDGFDGGLPNANPLAAVQTACNKAYVLRYNRDQIAIIDPTDTTSGKPIGWIDLSPLKQAGDPDSVEPTSAIYVPSKKRVYVLLGNADLTRVVKRGIEVLLLCSDLKPSIIAIDVETDKIVSLGGTAPGGGIALQGYNSVQVPSLAYDATLDRLLVLEGGCNTVLDDAGPGDMTRRRVEAVDLGTGAVTNLLALDDRGFPSSFAYASQEHAAVAFYFDGYHWDTRQPSLGDAISGGLDFVTGDRQGAFVGSRQTYGDGGVPGPIEIVSVPVTDAGPSVIVSDPFTKPGGYISGIEGLPGK